MLNLLWCFPALILVFLIYLFIKGQSFGYIITLLITFIAFIPVTIISIDYLGAQEEIRKNQNLIEYFKERDQFYDNKKWYEKWQTPGIPVEVAYTITSVNFRENPNTLSKVIEVLPESSKINLKPNWIGKREGDWFQVGYKNNIGWINGKYLRPTTVEEQGSYFLEGINLSWKLIFPEETFWGKVLGVIVAAPINILFNILLIIIFGRDFEIRISRGSISLEEISMVAPLAYLTVKNNILISYSIGELMIAFFPLIILSVITSVPSGIVEEQIQNRFF